MTRRTLGSGPTLPASAPAPRPPTGVGAALPEELPAVGGQDAPPPTPGDPAGRRALGSGPLEASAQVSADPGR